MLISRAHPRSRGENILSAMASLASLGSSPLTRGKRRPDRCQVIGPGLIPAHAGKTRAGYSLRHTSRAHPRSRGENTASYPRDSKVAGSSPLTRGKQRHEQPRNIHRGLIPAHAGKTALILGSPHMRWAHPRSRGENFLRMIASWPFTGSSPLTRGKRGAVAGAEGCHRLIPAHAGKTWRENIPAAGAGAHPRSRGENRAPRLVATAHGGSSPLTRGKLVTCRGSRRCQGLIPAHAGKTWFGDTSRDGGWAHPRSRGENQERAKAQKG